MNSTANSIYRFVLERRRQKTGCLVVGLCGAQGSGKSTATEHVAKQLRADGIRTATLSIDDLYLPRAARIELAQRIHPLLETRGPPGTHDTNLGLALFSALTHGQAVALPRFDKAMDDRSSPETWEQAPADTEVLLFEGWCVGARPESLPALQKPLNALEEQEDAQGIWRSYVNTALRDEYQKLFAAMDCLVLLAAPNFDVVLNWRREQEAALRRQISLEHAQTQLRVMDDATIARFIQHYERLTRHILATMPGHADLTIYLDEERSVRSHSLRQKRP